jgi:hypothetical protein
VIPERKKYSIVRSWAGREACNSINQKVKAVTRKINKNRESEQLQEKEEKKQRVRAVTRKEEKNRESMQFHVFLGR